MKKPAGLDERHTLNIYKMENEKNNTSGFISEPKTIQDFEQNARFQFENVAGWMSAPDYDLALLKAKNLVEALEDLVEHKKQKLAQ